MVWPAKRLLAAFFRTGSPAKSHEARKGSRGKNREKNPCRSRGKNQMRRSPETQSKKAAPKTTACFLGNLAPAMFISSIVNPKMISGVFDDIPNNLSTGETRLCEARLGKLIQALTPVFKYDRKFVINIIFFWRKA
jgi:hypothetical protein